MKNKLILPVFSTYLFETTGHPFDVSMYKLIKTIKSDFDVSMYKLIKTIKSNASFLKYNPVKSVADPFLFVNNDSLFLFYEKQILMNNGTIEMTYTKDLINWSAPITVLKHSTHLSYPFVFEDYGNVFMIPETYQKNNIQLYKANYDLTKWAFEKEILHGENYVDTSIFIHDNVYYLFTTVENNNVYQLHLFFADKLLGEFKKHPQSPIAIGDFIGRCGGSVFKLEDKIYRPVQIRENHYGESLSIFQIKVLSPTDYQEELEIEKFLSKPSILNGHHFNFTKFNNKLIIATDAVNVKFNFFQFYYRIINKVKKMIYRQKNTKIEK